MEKIQDIVKENKQRVLFWDIARGIAIILMIVGHCIPKTTWVYKLIYSFHMPLFVIVSGYFMKESEKFSKMIPKMITKWILPAIIVWTVAQSIMFQLKGWEVPWNLHLQILIGQFKTLAPSQIEVLWFIPFLIEIKLIFTGLLKLTKGKLLPLGVLSFIITSIGYIVGTNNMSLPIRLDIAFACLFLCYLGYLAKRTDGLNWIWKKKWIFAIITILWLILAFTSKVDIAIRIYGFLGVGLLGGVCGTIVVCKISELIEKKLPKLGEGLAFCGKHSLAVLLAHEFERRTIFLVTELKPRTAGIGILALRTTFAIVGTIVFVGIKEQIIQMTKAIKRKEKTKEDKKEEKEEKQKEKILEEKL